LRDPEGAFGLVAELCTVQARYGQARGAAIKALPGLVAPGGTLLVIARAADEEDPVRDPAMMPWPLPAEAVEFPVPHTSEKSVPFIGGEPENRPSGIPAVANADRTFGQTRHLDAVAVGVTQGALDPVET
jgi:hypothetical protein